MSACRPSLRVLGAIAVLVSAMVAGPFAGGVAMGATTNEVGALDDTANQQSTPTENNSTQQHENPEEVNENGDLGRLQSHLSSKLAERLVESSIQLNQGEYETAKDLVGDDYSDALEKYVDVTGDLDGDGASDELDSAQDQQREYADTVQEYRDTLEEYREARRNGNETKARQHARRLNQLASEANATHEELVDSYTTIGNETGANVTTAIQNLNDIQSNISATQAEINETTFVETILTVEADDENASFTDPVTLSGKLATENGTAIANETVRIDVGSKSYTVTTDADGRFQISYRPIRTNISLSALAVRYVPNATSVYLGNKTSVPIVIEQTTATVTITDVTQSASFGDEVLVTGVLTVNGTPVPNIPLDVILGGTNLGTVTTASDGTFELRTSLPAVIQAGSRQFIVAGAASGEAIAVQTSRRSLQVQETATNLSITEAQADDGAITITGSLTTANGEPVSGQPVEVRVNGTLLTTVRTRADGTFRTTVQPSSTLDMASVEVEFTGAGTNLGPSQAEMTLSLGGPGDATQSIFDRYPWLRVLIPGAVVLLIAGAVIIWWRDIDLWPLPTEAGGGPGEEVDPLSPAAGEANNAMQAEAGLLAAARELVSEGRTNSAVKRAYESVRALFDSPSPAQTHWEFFNSADLSGDRRQELRELTTLFEQATFGPTDADEETAQSAVETAESLVEEVREP